MFLFPAIISAYESIMHLVFNSFVAELVMIVVSTFVVIVVANRNGTWDYWIETSTRYLKGEGFLNLRNALIAVTCSVLLLSITSVYNVNSNPTSPVLWLVCAGIAIIVATIMVFFVEIFKPITLKDRPDPYRNVSYLVLVVASISLLPCLYLNFGTQFIWVSALLVTICLWVLAMESEFKQAFTKKTFLKNCIIVTPALVALVSTSFQFLHAELLGIAVWKIVSISGALVCIALFSNFFSEHGQADFWLTFIFFTILAGIALTLQIFWFTRIFWQSMPVWEALIFVLVLIGAIVAVKYGVKAVKEYLAEKKRAKIVKQKIDQVKKEHEVELQQIRDELKRALSRILAADVPEWSDIFYVERNTNTDNKLPDVMLKKIHLANLKTLVTISKFKRQIVWASSLRAALKLIDAYAAKIYDDTELNLLVSQLGDFINAVSPYKEFIGYNELILEITTHCDTVFKLFPIKE